MNLPNTVAPHLAAYPADGGAAQQRDYLTHLHQTLNAPSHPFATASSASPPNGWVCGRKWVTRSTRTWPTAPP